MRRRDFIKVVAGSAAAWPLAVRAQASLLLISFMSSRSSNDSEPHSAAFLRGLSEAGYIPGQNARIEYRWADGHYERLPEIASELVKLPLAALVAAGGEPSAQAAKSATASIPIIFCHRRRSAELFVWIHAVLHRLCSWIADQSTASKGRINKTTTATSRIAPERPTASATPPYNVGAIASAPIVTV